MTINYVPLWQPLLVRAWGLGVAARRQEQRRWGRGGGPARETCWSGDEREKQGEKEVPMAVLISNRT
jgi:hypothetical protein